jgi:hypothetical protein
MPKSLLALVLVVGALAAAAPAQANTLLCESKNGRTNRCPADTRDGVRLVTQLSHQGCYEGDTWGYERGAIWVSNGCRAKFQTGSHQGHQDNRDHEHSDAAAAVAIGVLGVMALAASNDREDRRDDYRDDYRAPPPPRPDYAYAPDQIIRCESGGDRRAVCPVRIGRDRVEIHRKLSKSSCRFKYSWGYDRRGIWVDKGCRADFAVLR